jgi:glycerol-3-phosphate acyltransferase PlsY
MNTILALALGYLIGSVPFAFLVTRGRGIDLRHIGSGNVGAANVLRTTGVPSAVTVMLLDSLKGSVAVLAAQAMTTGAAAPVAAGIASILGHIYPVWLRFHGGKGVATAAGVFGVLAPIALVIASGVFVLTIVVTRFISAGSLAAAFALTIAAVSTGASGAVVVGAVGAALIVLYMHRANLVRLAAGTEQRIGLRLFEQRR